jgi:Uma2 family endonuclease
MATARTSITAKSVDSLSVSRFRTVADLLDHLGRVSPARVRFQPWPGTATVRDVVAIHDAENRLFELVDGVLVEKAMGFDESIFAVLLSGYLLEYFKTQDLGKVIGADGLMRIFPDMVRIPDVAFISWPRFPKGKRRRGEIPLVVPDLVVEVLSRENTRKEMARKLDEYLQAGVRVVWYVDPGRGTVRVHEGRGRSVLLREGQALDGGAVLPGFSSSICEWFAKARRGAPRHVERVVRAVIDGSAREGVIA